MVNHAGARVLVKCTFPQNAYTYLHDAHRVARVIVSGQEEALKAEEEAAKEKAQKAKEEKKKK